MEKDFRFNLHEIAGAIGDYGTLLPIVMGVAVVSEVNLSHILFFFALSYIATGIYYHLPMPVEPMKAIGVIAIAGTLSAAEIAGAGILMGLILLLLGITGSIEYIKKYIPSCIIRGIQLGLALTLMKQALNFIISDWQLGLVSLFLVLLFTFAPILDISALVVFAIGLAVGIYYHGLPPITYFSLPHLLIPTTRELLGGFVNGVLPQLPLSLGNAVLATSLLITDLLNRRVPEKKLVLSMSLMCLISAPLGGFPMCHGAGGLAAQYRFGARTGGSNIISGIILLIVALFFAGPELTGLIPYGALGALLLFSSFELGKSAVRTDNFFFTATTGIIALFFGITLAFVILFLLYWLFHYLKINKLFNR
ncbi:MAG: putative sulfate/molybdate transporter [Bacillota bacterium]|nr:putative sulfate/molybdate transporter [Bacillota bacterium]